VLALYFDEDSTWRSLVEGLRLRGLDIVTAAEAGLLGLADDAQLSFAAQEQRTLWTFNIKDFYGLHGQWLAAGKRHSGIILVQQQKFGLGEMIRRTVLLARALESAEMQSRCEFLSNWS
jgi:hypothetical protein